MRRNRVPQESAIGRRVGILGAGRQAVEAAGYCKEAGLEPAFFVEEGPPNYERAHDDYGAAIYQFVDNIALSRRTCRRISGGSRCSSPTRRPMAG